MGFELIETRYVSGKGIIKLPFDKAQNRALKLYIDVIRRPRNRYVNYAWNPAKSFYANLTFCRADYVYQEKAIHYDQECIDLIPDISGQNLFALKCVARHILVGLAILGDPLGVNPVTNLEPLAEFKALTIDWDTVKVQCYADTAIALRLYRLKYEVCDPDDDKEEPPGEPPPPLPPVPPGEPLNQDNYPVSPPYDEGDTVPFPDDEIEKPDFPQGGDCEIVTVTYINVVIQPDSGLPPVISTNAFNAFAPINDLRISADGITVEVESKGVLASPGIENPVETCQEDFAYYVVITTPVGVFIEIELVSVVPVP